MTLRFAVVHEAYADLQTAMELADRAILEAIDWLDDDLLPYQREWVANTTDGRPFTWKGMKHLAAQLGIRAHGHFGDGEVGFPDAAAARRAILCLLKTAPQLNGIVLIRDQDDQPTRKKGLEQARNQDGSGVSIVVGFAIVERECWVVSGFDPLDDAERSRLDSEKNKLGFDPRLQSHQLTACKNDAAVRSSKRVLRELTGNDEDRERHCWKQTRLGSLRDRGRDNGLEAFLNEVRDRLGPLFETPNSQ